MNNEFENLKFLLVQYSTRVYKIRFILNDKNSMRFVRVFCVLLHEPPSDSVLGGRGTEQAGGLLRTEAFPVRKAFTFYYYNGIDKSDERNIILSDL